MNILVTGGTGRLGRTLCPKLVSKGYHLFLLTRNSTDLSPIQPWLEQVTLVNHDSGELDACINNSPARFDICLHMATAYRKNNAGEREIQAANVDLPRKLAEILSRKHPGVFINIDTALPAGINAYADSKARFRDYLRTFDAIPKRITLLLQQFYGIQDDNDGIIPAIIDSISRGTPRFDLTPGLQKRDFIHIEDVCTAIIATIGNTDRFPAGYSEYQIGSGTATSIRSLVDLAKSQFASCHTEFRFGALPYRENEPMEMVADYSAFQQITGWEPRISIAEGIHSLVTSFNKTTTD
jgi:CDP-paratose synthetase